MTPFSPQSHTQAPRPVETIHSLTHRHLGVVDDQSHLGPLADGVQVDASVDESLKTQALQSVKHAVTSGLVTIQCVIRKQEAILESLKHTN